MTVMDISIHTIHAGASSGSGSAIITECVAYISFLKSPSILFDINRYMLL